MNINYLREFVVLAQTGNFLEASEKLFISQSTLSKHIKNIEGELNVPLFIRTTRKVELSKYGQLLLPYAMEVIHIEGEYTKAILRAMEGTEKKITIGSIPALAQYKITDALVKFKQEHPDIHMEIVQAGSQGLKKMLREGECDLAFIRESSHEDKEFARIEYDRDHLIAVLPANHPLAGKDCIRLESLKDEEFILLDKSTMVYTISMDACRRSGFTPRVSYTDYKIENIIDLVGKGMGVAMMMDNLARHNINDTIKVMNLASKVSTKINLCYRKDTALSMAAKHFIRCLDLF